MDGTLYFVADDGTSGAELWKSDGTESGTVRVTDLRPGSQVPSPTYLTNIGGTLYFRANDGATGFELWKAVARQDTTTLVHDFMPGIGDGSRGWVAELNGRLVVAARTGEFGEELWIERVPIPDDQNSATDRVDAADYVALRKYNAPPAGFQHVACKFWHESAGGCRHPMPMRPPANQWVTGAAQGTAIETDSIASENTGNSVAEIFATDVSDRAPGLQELIRVSTLIHFIPLQNSAVPVRSGSVVHDLIPNRGPASLQFNGRRPNWHTTPHSWNTS